MKQTLPFSNEAYAFGAGVFFIGYLLFEVPSNLMLEKIGARKTLLRIMVCWGICACLLMFVQTTTQFYILRFLLGAFEAGFFPGIILYLTYWFPGARRGKVIAIFMTATSITNIISGPVSGSILKYMDGVLGHHGWQWMFVIQGLPAVFLGIFAFFYLQIPPPENLPNHTNQGHFRLKSESERFSRSRNTPLAYHTKLGSSAGRRAGRILRS